LGVGYPDLGASNGAGPITEGINMTDQEFEKLYRENKLRLARECRESGNCNFCKGTGQNPNIKGAPCGSCYPDETKKWCDANGY